MTSFSAVGGTTFYIRESGGQKQYSTNQTSWTNIVFPVTVTNTTAGQPNPTVLKVEFITDITLSSINDYFTCASSYIQFGSSSLKNDGSRPIINIPVNNYDGFIANGDTSIVGNSNIYVYNLSIVGIGSLQVGAGWLGKKGFGNSRDNNYIINCSSSGNIDGTSSGGIVGSNAGTGNGGLLYILGCSSSGTIGNTCGGIVGGFAGNSNGKCYCIGCYSTGSIGGLAGGIAGYYAGNAIGLVSITACYSTNDIGIQAGGIVGAYSQNTTVISSYSRGNINNFAGGIFGQGTLNSSFAINCYSQGTISPFGSAGGIFGQGSFGNASNCYSSNGSWQDSAANNVLIGYPSTFNVGEIWIKRGTNQPYELNNFPVSYLNPDENSSLGYSPYLTANINTTATPYLVQSFNQTISASSSTSGAIVSGNSYEILDISQSGSIGSYPTITINSSTGVISTTQGTAGGVYTIYVRSVQNTGYSVTTFNLTVNNQVDLNAFYLLLLLLLRRRRYQKHLAFY